jgi:1-deoxy-D-xylulose-5-phosphate synthase
MRNLLHTAIEQTGHPFAIRYPKEECPADPAGAPFETIPIGSWEHLIEGEDLAFLAVGTMVEHARPVVAALAKRGVKAGLVNCRFVKPMDTALLKILAHQYRYLVTLEENTLRGGFGTGVYEELQAMGIGPGGPSLRHLGIPDQFVAHGSRSGLFEEIGLSPAQIESFALSLLVEKIPVASGSVRAGDA